MTDSRAYTDPARSVPLCDVGSPGFIACVAIGSQGDETAATNAHHTNNSTQSERGTMRDERTRRVSDATKPLSPLPVLAVVLAVAGLMAWAWLGDWRWMVTGIGSMFVVAIIGTYVERRPK